MEVKVKDRKVHVVKEQGKVPLKMLNGLTKEVQDMFYIPRLEKNLLLVNHLQNSTSRLN